MDHPDLMWPCDLYAFWCILNNQGQLDKYDDINLHKKLINQKVTYIRMQSVPERKHTYKQMILSTAQYCRIKLTLRWCSRNKNVLWFFWNLRFLQLNIDEMNKIWAFKTNTTC